jgi:hypothetical protein
MVFKLIALIVACGQPILCVSRFGGVQISAQAGVLCYLLGLFLALWWYSQ